MEVFCWRLYYRLLEVGDAYESRRVASVGSVQANFQ